MKAKLYIDLKEGKLEVEGSAALAREVYKDFKNQLDTVSKSAGSSSKTSSKTARKTKPQSNATGKQFKVVPELDLKATKSAKKSLKGFLNEYDPKSSEDLTLLVVYYLKRYQNVQKVTSDHIHTCYKEIGRKTPKSLMQILYNQKNKKGFIDIGSKTGVTYQNAGEKHLESIRKKAASASKGSASTKARSASSGGTKKKSAGAKSSASSGRKSASAKTTRKSGTRSQASASRKSASSSSTKKSSSKGGSKSTSKAANKTTARSASKATEKGTSKTATGNPGSGSSSEKNVQKEAGTSTADQTTGQKPGSGQEKSSGTTSSATGSDGRGQGTDSAQKSDSGNRTNKVRNQ